MSYKVSYSMHVGDPPPYKYFYVGDPLPVDSNKITYRELYPGDYYPYTTDRIKLNPTPDQYKIGYRDGFADGFKAALKRDSE